MEIEESVRGKDVFIIQSGGGSGTAPLPCALRNHRSMTHAATVGASHERIALTFSALQ